uniref:Secreted protein n=1 Tax=Anguilla anguilla TaxID=7936 RepID=A0A0E9XGU0_ANGAN
MLVFTFFLISNLCKYFGPQQIKCTAPYPKQPRPGITTPFLFCREVSEHFVEAAVEIKSKARRPISTFQLCLEYCDCGFRIVERKIHLLCIHSIFKLRRFLHSLK